MFLTNSEQEKLLIYTTSKLALEKKRGLKTKLSRSSFNFKNIF